ncbi:MAG: type IV pilus modification PilV family protein, partial [Planctomycetota bacterium]
MNRPFASQRGFSLIEILLALAIMAFGITVALGLLTLATATHKRAVDRTNTALLAEAISSQVRGAITLNFDAAALPVSPGGGRILLEDETNPAYPSYRFDVFVTPIGTDDVDAADGFHVEIVIRFLQRGRSRTYTYN